MEMLLVWRTPPASVISGHTVQEVGEVFRRDATSLYPKCLTQTPERASRTASRADSEPEKEESK